MKSWHSLIFGLAVGCAACASKSPATVDATMDAVDASGPLVDAAPLPIPDSCEGGRVIYGIGGEHFRTTLSSVATTENLSLALNSLSAGSENWVSSSPDGEWLVMETDRFDPNCEGYPCLAVVKSDLSSGEAITIAGDLLHGDSYSAIASGGDRVIYPLSGGPHNIDLYAITRSNGAWSSPTLLTAASPSAFNLQPSISADGSKIVFDCGEDPYSQPPTSICEVGTDGSGFRVVWTPEQGGVGAPGRADVALHHPSYFSDGSIAFEADWSGEQIWHLTGQGPPVRIAGDYSNDNSPCVMANDCVVSIWLERPEGTGTHEIKIMDSAGGNFAMIRTDIDVVDIGTSCSL